MTARRPSAPPRCRPGRSGCGSAQLDTAAARGGADEAPHQRRRAAGLGPEYQRVLYRGAPADRMDTLRSAPRGGACCRFGPRPVVGQNKESCRGSSAAAVRAGWRTRTGHQNHRPSIAAMDGVDDRTISVSNSRPSAIVVQSGRAPAGR